MHIQIMLYIYIHTLTINIIIVVIIIVLIGLCGRGGRRRRAHGGQLYGQFSKFKVCFCGLDPGNLKF